MLSLDEMFEVHKQAYDYVEVPFPLGLYDERLPFGCSHARPGEVCLVLGCLDRFDA